MIIIDDQSLIRMWTRQSEAIFGYSAEEVTGKPVGQFIMPDRFTDLHMQGMRRYLSTGIPHILNQRIEITGRRKNGEEFPVEITVIPIQEGSSQIFCAFVRDISVDKLSKETLENARKAAEEANRAKSAFLANMSHEIRTPMNAVHGIVRLLSEAPHLPEQEEHHNRLISSPETLLAIINDILDFSKIEAGLMTVEKIPFSRKQVLSNLLGTMEMKANQKSLLLIHDTDDGIAPVLIGDPVRLGQVLLNLISNAIKFTEHGQVKFQCSLIAADNESNTVRFSVSDTGIGIEESRLTKIFESYEQEDSGTTRKYGGTGLGLSISRQLVELMGGTLQVESTKNVGSLFHFTLTFPLGQDGGLRTEDGRQKTEDGRHERGIEVERLRGVRVLVVEDNEMNQFVAKSILMKWNMEVFQARNGKKAIEFLENEKCDIILMDKHM